MAEMRIMFTIRVINHRGRRSRALTIEEEEEEEEEEKEEELINK